MLSSSQALFPGWRARVDGEHAPVQVVDGLATGVVLPRGARQVVLSYHPPGLAFGALVTVLALLVLVGQELAGRLERPAAARGPQS